MNSFYGKMAQKVFGKSKYGSVQELCDFMQEKLGKADVGTVK